MKTHTFHTALMGVLALVSSTSSSFAGEPSAISGAQSGGVCQASSPASADLIEDWGGNLVINKKMRYISFSGGDAGRSQAIKVTLSNLPAPYDIWNGQVMWVGPLDEYSEGGGRGHDRPCTIADPCAGATYISSELQCDPFFLDWTTVGTVHVRSESIVPSAAYCVQVVDSACPLDQDASYSAPTNIPTARFADICGLYKSGVWTAADEEVGLPSDLLGSAGVFSGGGGTTAPSLVRAEINGGSSGGFMLPDLDGKYSAADYISGQISAFPGFSTYNAVPSTAEFCPGSIYAAGSACTIGSFACGDGSTNPGEACDDGNLAPGDGCDEFCRIESDCGNGILEFSEECDDGGISPGDGCDAQCRSEGDAIISLVPVSASGGFNISGDEITLDSGSQRVFLEYFLENWDPELDNSPTLRTWQVQLDGESYTSGLYGSLTPAAEPCTNDEDCLAALGGVCSITGDPCAIDDTCPLDPIEHCRGSVCEYPFGVGGFCTPIFMHRGRADYVFDSGDLEQIDLRTNAFRIGSFAQNFGVPDPGVPQYLGTLVVDVSFDAAGTFTLDTRPAMTSTALAADARDVIPTAELVPALITVNNPLLFDCCFGDGTCAEDTAENCILGGGTIVESCDCDGDQVLDNCGGDCNDNGLSDACEIFDGDQQDCNNNGIPDECDLAALTSDDCDGNSVPDECDVDCNDNDIPDTCDLADQTSDDCNTNNTPDECEPDCDGNGIPNDCDITNATSVDVDVNGVPDECECPPADIQSEVTVMPKNRHISFIPGNWGQQTALRVTVTSAPVAFSSLVGLSMWVGQPRNVSELGGLSDDTPPTYKTATLQCDPFFTDWGTMGTVHIYHQNIIPEAVYTVEAIDDSCDSGDPLHYTAPLEVTTPLWTDIVGGFVDGEWEPPDGTLHILDRVALIDRFASRPGSPSKARADLVPDTPDQRIDVTDLVAVLDGFRGVDYDLSIDVSPCVP